MRKKQNRANISELRTFSERYPMLRRSLAFIMSNSGATYREIGEVLNITRQQASNIVSEVTKEIKNQP